jgi:hypothetical protein
LSLSSGTQTACDPNTNFYTQDVIVEYVDAPSSGMLIVNGQNFGITGSPQTVTLMDLISDGNAVNVDASFSINSACRLSVPSLFTAPANCIPIDFEVFPNPSQSGIFQVRLNGAFYTDVQLKLSDALGRDLNINISISIEQGVEILELDLSDFVSGVYRLQLISTGGIFTKTLVK